MELLFFFVFIIILLFGLSSGPYKEPAEHCTRHIWRHNDSGDMYCVTCKAKPGGK
jgi:hypothetical protein